jgi:hypothetical protein
MQNIIEVIEVRCFLKYLQLPTTNFKRNTYTWTRMTRNTYSYCFLLHSVLMVQLSAPWYGTLAQVASQEPRGDG